MSKFQSSGATASDCLQVARNNTVEWLPDVLGAGYRCRIIALGPDPDGEGDVFATLVHHETQISDTGVAVLYVHGFTDYFFQQHLAEHFAARGDCFYALDLRKCGRSLRDGQTPHYIRDLAVYDAELNEALRIVRAETGQPVVVMAHSTGGLVVSLWLDRVRPEGVVAAVLNSPWLDLHVSDRVRPAATALVGAVGRVAGRVRIPLSGSSSYGDGIYTGVHGEWDYNLAWKPLSGFPVTFGFLRAVRRGQKELQRGLDIGVPALVLRSTTTRFARDYHPGLDIVDSVLDVRQIQRWSGCLGSYTTIVPIPDARHDVFLSLLEARETAFAELDNWLAAIHNNTRIPREFRPSHT